MALFVRQDQQRSDLQRRISADLQEKARRTPLQTTDATDDQQERYEQGTKQTTSLAWVWVLITITTIAVAIWLIVIAAS